MFQEFVTGCRTFHDIGQAVTVFGSARFDESNRHYTPARKAAASASAATSSSHEQQPNPGCEYWQGVLDFTSYVPFRHRDPDALKPCF
jgi:hypothetical protein